MHCTENVVNTCVIFDAFASSSSDALSGFCLRFDWDFDALLVGVTVVGGASSLSDLWTHGGGCFHISIRNVIVCVWQVDSYPSTYDFADAFVLTLRDDRLSMEGTSCSTCKVLANFKHQQLKHMTRNMQTASLHIAMHCCYDHADKDEEKIKLPPSRLSQTICRQKEEVSKKLWLCSRDTTEGIPFFRRHLFSALRRIFSKKCQIFNT